MPTTYRADWVFWNDRKPMRNGVLTIDQGKVVSVKTWSNEKIDVDLGQSLVTPGFSNAHIHLDLGGLHQVIERPTSFTDWLETVVQYRRNSKPQVWDSAIQEGIEESLRHGTTSLGDISVGGRSLDLIKESKLGYCRVYLELIGLTPDRIEQALDQARGWIGPRNQSPYKCLSPHAPYTVSKHLLVGLHKFAKKTLIAMHVAETKEEVELIQNRTGPFREFLQKLGVWQPEELFGSMDELLQSLRQFKFLTLVHANYLTTEQWQWLNPPLTVVYCPRTHAYFGHDPHPYLEMLADGVQVCLGTDSLASNPDLSILEEARFLWRRDQGKLTGDALLGMACCYSLDNFVVIPHSAESSDPWELLWNGTSLPSAVYIHGKQHI